MNKISEMEAFNSKLEAGEIDEHIIEILKLINSSENYYTTSSCSGRIQLIVLPKLGDKPGSRILGKWHDIIEYEELDAALKSWDGKDILMLLVQSPVIHAVCSDLESALILRNIGSASGFKYSTIRSIQSGKEEGELQKNIIVEILSTERMDVPLGNKGKLYPEEDYLRYILELAAMCMERSRGKLERLKANLEKQLEGK
ncbi:MAG: hypothetical protein JSV49_06665 [Thermoplasmata archaeon]|nr:MAG: hypothetical protein JSV49_06665 [Thermoplasmata archaeon]